MWSFLGRLRACLSTVFAGVRPQGVRREQQACGVQPPRSAGAGDEGALSWGRRGRVREEYRQRADCQGIVHTFVIDAQSEHRA